mmetsp:Transcript_91131/g.262836  ORF Transcript_91131/g.262836 Transcript_91131/m.262836 type:complete len:229 (-) Transcript_91131:206-892(-)
MSREIRRLASAKVVLEAAWHVAGVPYEVVVDDLGDVHLVQRAYRFSRCGSRRLRPEGVRRNETRVLRDVGRGLRRAVVEDRLVHWQFLILRQYAVSRVGAKPPEVVAVGGRVLVATNEAYSLHGHDSRRPPGDLPGLRRCSRLAPGAPVLRVPVRGARADVPIGVPGSRPPAAAGAIPGCVVLRLRRLGVRVLGPVRKIQRQKRLLDESPLPLAHIEPTPVQLRLAGL